ncbi:MAG TPA: hypothetical protein VI322_00055 [Candidatus Saccharimonadia bacterium]
MKMSLLRPNGPWYVYGLVMAVWTVYTLSVVMAHISASQSYQLDYVTLNIIRLTFALPILVIWLLAAQSIMRFARYARLVAKTPEGPAFSRIAQGLGWLFAYVLALMILPRLAAMFAHSALVLPAVFVRNHLPVALLVVAFSLLYLGSVRLIKRVPVEPSYHSTTLRWLAYCVFVVIFVTIFFGTKADGTSPDGVPFFAVPHSVLLFTLILPSIIAWGLGLTAVFFVYRYSRFAKGSVYRAALRWLAAGLAASIGFTILVELVLLNTPALRGLGLATLSLLIYLFVAIYAVGGLLVARGASKLALIEEAL